MSDGVLDMGRRDERALAMRMSGQSLDAVAQRFGWTLEQAHEAVERALTRVTTQRDAAGVEHTRQLVEQRLDALLAGQWNEATDPSTHPIVKQGAAKVALSIIDRQTALMGANAPKHTVVMHTVTPDIVASTLERLFAARSGVEEVRVIRGELGGGDADQSQAAVDAP